MAFSNGIDPGRNPARTPILAASCALPLLPLRSDSLRKLTRSDDRTFRYQVSILKILSDFAMTQTLQSNTPHLGITYQGKIISLLP